VVAIIIIIKRISSIRKRVTPTAILQYRHNPVNDVVSKLAQKKTDCFAIVVN